MSDALNVLGKPLQDCCNDPVTGFFRDGSCRTGPRDQGNHTICARMTEEFLEFSAQQGNDLMTPRPDWNFPGLEPDDWWCLCAGRWAEAAAAGKPTPVRLASTEESALEVVDWQYLKAFAVDLPDQFQN
jgi:uncharacterized protein (DUF2237 family)